MSELYVYSDDDEKISENLVENVTVDAINKDHTSFGLLTYYIKEPEDLKSDAAKSNLSCENYLYQLFLKASIECKNKSNSLN